MDPNENLESQLLAAKQILQKWENGDIEVKGFINPVTELAELVLAMDEWLRMQGALPKRWER